MKRPLLLFRSVRFNIVLFVVLAAASAVGTLLPQAGESPEKVQAWIQAHAAWGRPLQGLGLFHLYDSWWYLALLGLLAFDIVVCKLWSAPPDAGLASLPLELGPEAAGREPERARAAIAATPLRKEFTAAGTAQEVAPRLRELVRACGYRLHPCSEAGADERACLVATRQDLQRWGSYLAHVALVMILLGGLLKQLFGFVEMVPVISGGSRAMAHRDWEMKVDDFTVQYYDGTRQPKLFSSDLKVYRGDKLLGAKVIKVNDPLDIGGVRFYQASWGAVGMFHSVTLKLGKQAVRVPMSTPTRIPGTDIRVTADMMLPSFVIGPDGRADSAGLDLENPAVRLSFRVGKKAARPLWLLESLPDAAFEEDEDGTLGQAPPPPFQVAEIDPVLFSGIQAAYDPGFKVVLAGGILWLAGMILLFYLHRRRLWVVLSPAGAGGVHVLVGGWSSRGPRDFEQEFEELTRRWSSELGAQGHIEDGAEARA